MTMKHWIKLVAPLAAFALLAAAGEPATDAEMSLREAVEYALAHSPDLKSSQTEVQRRARVGHHGPLIPDAASGSLR